MSQTEATTTPEEQPPFSHDDLLANCNESLAAREVVLPNGQTRWKLFHVASRKELFEFETKSAAIAGVDVYPAVPRFIWESSAITVEQICLIQQLIQACIRLRHMSGVKLKTLLADVTNHYFGFIADLKDLHSSACTQAVDDLEYVFQSLTKAARALCGESENDSWQDLPF